MAGFGLLVRDIVKHVLNLGYEKNIVTLNIVTWKNGEDTLYKIEEKTFEIIMSGHF